MAKKPIAVRSTVQSNLARGATSEPDYMSRRAKHYALSINELWALSLVNTFAVVFFTLAGRAYDRCTDFECVFPATAESKKLAAEFALWTYPLVAMGVIAMAATWVQLFWVKAQSRGADEEA